MGSTAPTKWSSMSFILGELMEVGVMLSLAVRCMHLFARSLPQPGTLHSCPRGLGCGNSLSAMTNMLVRRNQMWSPQITCPASEGRGIILTGHVSLLGAYPNSATLCLELVA